ncbi:hypothetical protein [Thauera aminoaromatica]|uniref:DUF2778 domain-containing protein n=1 Tax=Thauera aminoaromatica TaxID=164330 RepID=A0A5C7S3A5_THASP|nr:hypothetical protein [Thauera aminoaromatica]TXH78207.1 MAG: DUF2778 domain-containing protein [Thauera aminoaromatica]
MSKPRGPGTGVKRHNAAVVNPGPKITHDVVVADPLDRLEARAGRDRLTFDGYKLTWHGAAAKQWTAFSGLADESADEGTKDEGPTPQGLFTVDPKNIELLEPSDDWGSHRVRLDPQASTVTRMRDCLKVIRTGMYVHGGSIQGTKGCIELNDDREEREFFEALRKYGKPIELEVRYSGAREKKYERVNCPYPSV